MTIGQRVKRLQKVLPQVPCDGILLTSLENIRYVSGFTGSSGVVLLTSQESHFITDPRYDTQSREQVRGFKIHIVANQSPFSFALDMMRNFPIRSLGVEEERLMWQQAEKIRQQFIRLRSIQGELKKLRSRKDKEEIRAIQMAASIADQALAFILPWLRPGVREREIAEELEYQMRRLGAEKPAFDTIVASGHRSALPHGIASGKPLQKGDLVVVDFGANYHGYMSDMTRTFVIGKPSRRQKRIYEAVRIAQEKGLQKVKSGVPCTVVDQAPRNYLKHYQLDHLFVHGTGHGIGLEIHEPPTVSHRSQETLQEGMLITVEPGVYIPKWGGVRIEDTLLVTREGFRSLTRSPKGITL